MAGAFSGHLVNSFDAKSARHTAPFGFSGPSLVTSGAMSFNPQVHGTPMGHHSMAESSFAFNSPQPSFFNPELSDATTLKIAALQAKLNQKLGPEFVSQRPGPAGGPKLTYAEGWKIINLANEVFGFNGWSSSVINLTTDFVDFNQETRRYSVGTTAIIRVTLRDGVFHEDVGYGMLENSKSQGAALDKCKKEAVTDGLKRALRNFGNLLGNCLYDKSYAQEVVKIKVPPAKFDKTELYRRPEFEGKKPDITSMNVSTSASTSKADNGYHADVTTPTRPAHQHQDPKVLSSIPTHIRSEVSAASTSSNTSRNTIHDTHRMPTSVLGRSPHQNTMLLPQPQSAAQEPDLKPALPLPPITNTTNSDRRRNAPSNPPNLPKMPPNPPAPAPARVAVHMQEPLPDDLDESFHFYSDDDAFLANVDLGEGDLGQPVLPETDLGRPIGGEDGDSDLGRAIDPDEGLGGDSVKSSPSDHVRDEERQTGQQGGSSTSLGMLSRLLPQNQNQNQIQQQRQPSGVSGQSNNASRTNQSLVTSRLPNLVHQRGENNRPSVSATTTTSNSSSTMKRPTTPSMGGFNFPPGVDPRQLQAQSKPPQFSAQSSTSGIGQKRPLDTISSSTTSRRPPGMGLESRGGGQGAVKREVLGRLDIGEGGDVKRMRM